ncbi:MAG: UbiH/UbiF/VisC/COQ6 family ubiquinone biosynthesis hydroxylase, partial [Methylococcaceae bacterium]
VSALSIASRRILETVGAWNGITARRLCPYQRLRVWEKQGDTEFSSNQIKQSELGFIVENRITQLAVTERLKKFKNIDFVCPAKTKKINYGADRSIVELEGGRKLATRLLVAADGGQSGVRQAAGMGVSSWDYRQHALVLSVETASGQQDITWQRFVPSGPQAFLPLSGSRGSIVWYNTPDEVRRLKSLPDSVLLDELKMTFPSCLGEIKRILERGSFPLKRQHALDYVKEGIALIGDAAHMIHPLAGQGVNIGLLDAAALAQVIVDAKNSDEDFGCLGVLKRFEKLRRRENLVMMTSMDLFYRVFSNSIFPVQLLRNVGLGLAQRLTPAKNKVMRHAMGLEGNLPKLARGEPIVL